MFRFLPRLATRAGPRFRKTAVAALAAVIVALVAATGTDAAVRGAAAGRIFSAESVPAAPVAIVFGAGLRQDGSPSFVLEGRLETVRRLYAEGKAGRILVSGDNRWEHYDEPSAMRSWLAERGVPDHAIARDFAGRRTLDTCQRAHRLWGVERAILVTHDYHLPRALFLARDAGIDAAGVPAAWGWTRRAAGREIVARVAAWLDVRLLKTGPALWGLPESWPDPGDDD